MERWIGEWLNYNFAAGSFHTNERIFSGKVFHAEEPVCCFTGMAQLYKEAAIDGMIHEVDRPTYVGLVTLGGAAKSMTKVFCHSVCVKANISARQ